MHLYQLQPIDNYDSQSRSRDPRYSVFYASDSVHTSDSDQLFSLAPQNKKPNSIDYGFHLYNNPTDEKLVATRAHLLQQGYDAWSDHFRCPVHGSDALDQGSVVMLHKSLSSGLYAEASTIGENCGYPDNEGLLHKGCDTYWICHHHGRNDLAS